MSDKQPISKESAYYMCERKRRFKTEKNALKEIRRIRKTGRIITETFKPYKCPICHGFHLGHDRKGQYRN